jgi:hypothetical protein
MTYGQRKENSTFADQTVSPNCFLSFMRSLENVPCTYVTLSMFPLLASCNEFARMSIEALIDAYVTRATYRG